MSRRLSEDELAVLTRVDLGARTIHTPRCSTRLRLAALVDLRAEGAVARTADGSGAGIGWELTEHGRSLLDAYEAGLP